MINFEETLRLCRIMAGLGIRKIKVTGGEPLLRVALTPFIKDLKAIPGIDTVTMTTNGLYLDRHLDEAEALDALPSGVNISLDALSVGGFWRIARESGPADIPTFINQLIDRLLSKQIQVKINCVPMRSFNEREILPLASLAKDKDIAVRFIELMPIGRAAALKFIPGSEIAGQLINAFGPLKPFAGVRGNGPARYYSLPGFTGKVGFINPVSQGFCETCNRLRLDSEGFLKPCLSADLCLSLRALIRTGYSDEAIGQAITDMVAKKPRHHTFSDIYGATPEEIKRRRGNAMYKIGG
jgi:cyclic pyranopterin phosphate synthase